MNMGFLLCIRRFARKRLVAALTDGAFAIGQGVFSIALVAAFYSAHSTQNKFHLKIYLFLSWSGLWVGLPLLILGLIGLLVAGNRIRTALSTIAVSFSIAGWFATIWPETPVIAMLSPFGAVLVVTIIWYGTKYLLRKKKITAAAANRVVDSP